MAPSTRSLAINRIPRASYWLMSDAVGFDLIREGYGARAHLVMSAIV